LFIVSASLVLADIALAYLVFEFFLDYFRTQKLHRDRLDKLLNKDKENMGSGS